MLTLPPLIGKYEVVKRLRQGGMGTLYLARDPRLGRSVAIKVIRADIDSPALRERFEQEAQAVSRLRHPNIVTIHDYGEFEGQPYLAMEYIEGESLADLIARRAPLSLARKLQMIDEVCAGMTCVHLANLVHRDLKPDNIMVDGENGPVKILDFGIARSLETGMSHFTQGIGTPCYMSPEQVTSGRVDQRSDIFAIGTILYELLTYQRAFDGDTQVAIINKIIREEPASLVEFCEGLDPRVQAIVERALAKQPAARYHDVGAMRRHLEDLAEAPMGVRSVPNASIRRIIPLAAATTLVVGLAGGFWLAARARAVQAAKDSVKPADVSSRVPDGSLLTSVPSQVVAPTSEVFVRQASAPEGGTFVAFSPDARFVVSIGTDNVARFSDTATGLELRRGPQLNGLHPYGTSGWFAPSPDGRWLAAGDAIGTRLHDATSEAKIKAWRDGEVSSVTFSPDSRLLASGSFVLSRIADPQFPSGILGAHEGYNGRIIVRDVNTSRVVRTIAGLGAPTSLAFGPDGRFLVAADPHRDKFPFIDVSSGRTRYIPHAYAESVAVAADGKLLASINASEVRVWSVVNGEVTAPNKVFGERDPRAFGFPRAMAFSPDGKVLAVAEGWTLELRDVQTGRVLQQLIVESQKLRFGHVGFSLDGRWFAGSCYDYRGNPDSVSEKVLYIWRAL